MKTQYTSVYRTLGGRCIEVMRYCVYTRSKIKKYEKVILF